MRKTLCLLLSIIMLISLLPVSAAALNFDPTTKLPALTEAPHIDTVYSEDGENGTKVALAYTNSEEIMELFREIEKADGSESEYVKKLTGIDYGSITLEIQFAYRFNNNATWINDMDCDNYIMDQNLDVNEDGIEEYRDLPSEGVYKVLCSNETLVDFAGMYPKYVNAAVPAAMGQGVATRKSTEDEEIGYEVNFNTNKIHVKARYRIYSNYDDSNYYIAYSDWSDPVTYGAGTQFTYENSMTADGPVVELLRSSGNDFYMAIKPNSKLKSIISTYFALNQNDEIVKFYGDSIDEYGNYFVELRLKNGEWMYYDTAGYYDVLYNIEDYEIESFFENKGLTPQPGDTVQLRMHFLSNEKTDSDTGLQVPDDPAYVHSDYSAPIYLPFGGVYRINYHLIHGDFPYGTEQKESFDTESVEIIDITTEDYIPERYGYEFGGWYSTENFAEGTKVTSIDTSVKKYVDLYAKWNGDEYTVVYNSARDCYNPNPEMYTAIMNDITLENATATGFEFDGWYTTSTFEPSSKITVIDVSQAKNLTLYAKWKVPEFTITYVLNGGTNNAKNPAKFTAESPVTLVAPIKTGYQFDGWYYDNAFNNELYSTASGWTFTPENNITVYAKWIVGRWNITYVQPTALKNVYNQNPKVYTYGTPVSLKKLSTTGYSFNGWYTDSAFKNSATGTKATDTGNKTYYASWTENSYNINYVLNANPNMTPDLLTITNTNPTNRLYSKGIALKNPESSDGAYKFIGWFDNVNFDGNPIKTLSGDSTKTYSLYAKWIKHLWGDADLNGTVEAADARMILRCSVKLEVLSPETTAWCNLDKSADGVLSAADARLALRVSVKLDTPQSLKLPSKPANF